MTEEVNVAMQGCGDAEKRGSRDAGMIKIRNKKKVGR